MNIQQLSDKVTALENETYDEMEARLKRNDETAKKKQAAADKKSKKAAEEAENESLDKD